MSVDEILNHPAEETVIYNYTSEEEYDRARIICGDPTGIMNFNKTPHKWATDLFDKMHARDWSPNRISLSIDAKNYQLLTPVERRAYDLVLAQLITNDSIQAQQLSIGIDKYITSPIVGCCIKRQSWEEALHARSYTVMAEDVCKNTEEIYNLHSKNKELSLKNQAVADMYSQIYKDKNDDIITVKDVLLAFVANQVLEELVFPGGFVTMYSMEDKMKGTSEMIGEIHKDESLSHVPLFSRIFRTTIKELFNGVIPESLIPKAQDMIEIMTNAEKRWTSYLSNINQDWVSEISDVPVDERRATLKGFSQDVINVFIEGQANSVCKNLGLPLIYPESKGEYNPLKTLLTRHLSYARESVFESKGKEYNNHAKVDLGF